MQNQVTASSIHRLFHSRLSNNYDKDEITQFFFLLAEEYLGWTKSQVHAHMSEPLPETIPPLFEAALEQLVNCKPIQYILGHVAFSTIDLLVAPGVLIPRPETEELVQLIQKENNHRRFENFSLLDIGTGSGCIGLSLQKLLPHCQVMLVDVSQVALDFAAKNAARNQCQVSIKRMNILNELDWIEFPCFQVIVSNPPYIRASEKIEMRRNVLDYEPESALFVSDDDPLVFYRAIAHFGWLHLVRPGLLYVEINESLGKEICELFKQIGYERVELMQDIYGKDRFVRGEAKSILMDTSYWHVEH